METIRYNELKQQEERKKKQDNIYNSSPKNDNTNKLPQILDQEKVPEQRSSLSDEAKSQNSEIIPGDEDNDDWQNISYGEYNMDGMQDPFQNKFKNMVQEYKKLSHFSMKYESWSLKAMIVKANDDLR